MGSSKQAKSNATGSAPSFTPASAIEAEVAGNVLSQRCGPGGRATVADLDLPREFVERVADRVIRDSFYERSRVCVGVVKAAQALVKSGTVAREGSDRATDADGGAIRVVRWGERAAEPSTSADAPSFDQRAAEIVGARLAKAGLLVTLVELIGHFGAKRVSGADGMEVLAGTGFPVELLGGFEVEEVGRADMAANPSHHCCAEDGEQWHTLVMHLCRGGAVGDVRFRPRASCQGFLGATDGGESEAGMIRLQATRATHFMGAGDGGCLDMIGQVVRALPAAECFIGARDEDAEELVVALSESRRRANPGSPAAPITVIAGPRPVSQWAVDNAKAGTANGARVTLAPYFADTGEEKSKPAEDETLMLSGLEAAGEHVVRSPLLFQGGNIMLCRDAARNERVMLVGEAEIHRNRARGLTHEQALDWLRIEIGADRAVVLPAISYHIDYELSVRAGPDGRNVAFVNDTEAAARLMLAAGWEALARGGLCSTADVASAKQALGRGAAREALMFTWKTISPHLPGGVFNESFAALFSTSAVDCGVSNTRRFLLAMDLLTSEIVAPDEFGDPHFQALLRGWVRKRDDRRKLRARLESLGWKVVAIPSLSEGNLSINALNGIHLPGRFLIPTFGGLFDRLDKAAIAAFASILGPNIEVVSIRTSESQRREGGVRCSCAIYPVVEMPCGKQNRE